jgi:hypothetical protein
MKQIKRFTKSNWHIKTLLVFSILGNDALAQLYCSVSKSESVETIKCLHENQQISSIVEWDKEQKWGKLIINKSDGSLIQEWELRRIHGIASADIEYHTNGQVSKVEYRSAPDGGIQRFQRVYYYNQNGDLVNTVQDDYPSKIADVIRFEETPIPTNTIVCAEIWTSVMQLQNRTKRTQKIKITPLLKNSQTSERVMIIKPKQTITVDSCIQAQFFQDPKNNVKIEFLKTEKSPQIEFKKSYQSAQYKNIYLYEFK